MLLLQQMATTMVDTSKTLVGCHEAADIDPRNRQNDEKLNKIHEELSNTMENFKDRFAMILGDMKYLTEDPKRQQEIKDMAQKLKNKKPDRNPKDIGKEAFELISLIDPETVPPPAQSPAKNPYTSPDQAKTKYSTANTKQFSAHNDKPASADKNPIDGKSN
jgi:hypothetical protein